MASNYEHVNWSCLDLFCLAELCKHNIRIAERAGQCFIYKQLLLLYVVYYGASVRAVSTFPENPGESVAARKGVSMQHSTRNSQQARKLNRISERRGGGHITVPKSFLTNVFLNMRAKKLVFVFILHSTCNAAD